MRHQRSMSGIIVCLGKLLRENGTPEPELLTRCEEAYQVHKDLRYPIITSGGDTANIGITEAEFMRNYIIQNLGLF